MVEITKLSFEEQVGLRPDRLAELYVQLGKANAQDVVCRAIEELAVRLKNLEGMDRTCELATVRKKAKGLIGIAEQIGMQRLADVAHDLQYCAGENDTVAFAAVMARLLRVGDYSLIAVWDLQDLSG